MRLRLNFFITAFLLCSYCSAQDWKVFPYQPPGSLISFPKDEGRHTSEPVEWWYVAGHIKGVSSGKTYSFMISYFYYSVSSFDGFRILNLTDDATGEFYQDTKAVNYNTMATNHLDLDVKLVPQGSERFANKEDGTNKLIPYQYSLKSGSPEVQVNFDITSVKRPLILGKTGLLNQGISNYSYYYSQTKNDITGSLTLNGVTEGVTGTSWIDRQYGNFNPWTGEKYEWFQVQLSNGMDINFWNIFSVTNTIPDNNKYRLLSAYVDENNQYSTADFKIERLGYYWMSDSLMCYSSKWRLTSPQNKIDLTITTQNNNTEVKVPFRFFEGATIVEGTVNGKAVSGVGFAELLHSYAHPLPAITNPVGDVYSSSSPITWQLLNPDEGNPVTYKLEYSVNNKATFETIAEGLKDTFYLWNNPPIENGNKIWFKITAQSIDGTLVGNTVSPASSTVVMGEENTRIKLFPNPVDNILYLQPSFNMDNPPCKIIDANGRVVQMIQGNSLSNKIDVPFLSPGMYFLKIGNKAGIKFIKK